MGMLLLPCIRISYNYSVQNVIHNKLDEVKNHIIKDTLPEKVQKGNYSRIVSPGILNVSKNIRRGVPEF